MNKPIKVFLVEDSPVALTILQRILSSSSEVEVVGTARDGIDALTQIPLLKPDVVCTDLLMGKMDGLELTQQLMSQFPKPILAISDVVSVNDTQNIVQLLDAGVVDIFAKPQTGFIQDYERQKEQLINKIKILSGVKVFAKRNQTNFQLKSIKGDRNLEQTTKELPSKNPLDYQIIAIGVSTGGPKALQQIFSNLPANFPLPIVCTQHISVGFLASLISWLNLDSKLKVKIAKLGEKPLPGIVYFAPENYHLEIDNRGKFCYSQAEPFNSHRPSATVMMQSLVEFYGNGIIGILLTGMGKDGVLGMQKISSCGGFTIAQDKASSVIFGMPQEAIKIGAIREVLSIEEIAPFLLRKVGYISK